MNRSAGQVKGSPHNQPSHQQQDEQHQKNKIAYNAHSACVTQRLAVCFRVLTWIAPVQTALSMTDRFLWSFYGCGLNRKDYIPTGQLVALR